MMKIAEQSACGKSILLGEHAVVYGQPAIAIPMEDVRAFAWIEENDGKKGITVQAVDLGEEIAIEKESEHQFSVVIKELLKRIESENLSFSVKQAPFL